MRTLAKKREAIERRKHRIGWAQWMPGIHDRFTTDVRMNAAVEALKLQIMAEGAIEEKRLGRFLTEDEKYELHAARVFARIDRDEAEYEARLQAQSLNSRYSAL